MMLNLLVDKTELRVAISVLSILQLIVGTADTTAASP